MDYLHNIVVLSFSIRHHLHTLIISACCFVVIADVGPSVSPAQIASIGAVGSRVISSDFLIFFSIKISI